MRISDEKPVAMVRTILLFMLVFAQVALPFEHRRISLTDGVFSDEFMPYETHVYEIFATND